MVMVDPGGGTAVPGAVHVTALQPPTGTGSRVVVRQSSIPSATAVTSAHVERRRHVGCDAAKTAVANLAGEGDRSVLVPLTGVGGIERPGDVGEVVGCAPWRFARKLFIPFCL